MHLYVLYTVVLLAKFVVLIYLCMLKHALLKIIRNNGNLNIQLKIIN